MSEGQSGCEGDDAAISMTSAGTEGSLFSLRTLGFFQGVSDNAFICALSMATLNYNLALSSYVLFYLLSLEGVNSLSCAIMTSYLLVGLLSGQIIFGVIGDVLGREVSCRICIALMLIGSIFSLFAGLLFNDVVTEITVFRTALMVGAGGLYPLVATITKESTQQNLVRTTVAMVFGPLGSLGLVMAPLMVMIIGWLGLSANLTWRSILATGIVPILWLSTYAVTETHNEASQRLKIKSEGAAGAPATVYQYLLEVSLSGFKKEMKAIWKPPLRSLMLGITLSWFFSDILFYCNFLMQVLIIKTIIDNADDGDDDEYLTMTTIAGVGLISSVLFWFGGILSVNTLKHTSALGLMLQGFVLISILLLLYVIVTTFMPWNHLTLILFLAIYISIYFFIGYGPAPATFIVPSIMFPKQLRNTANGVSAGLGKIGAIVFTYMTIQVNIDLRGLMTFFCGTSVLGAASTIFTARVYMDAITIGQQRAARGAGGLGALEGDTDNSSRGQRGNGPLHRVNSDDSMDEAYYAYFRESGRESDPLLGARY